MPPHPVRRPSVRQSVRSHCQLSPSTRAEHSIAFPSSTSPFFFISFSAGCNNNCNKNETLKFIIKKKLRFILAFRVNECRNFKLIHISRISVNNMRINSNVYLYVFACNGNVMKRRKMFFLIFIFIFIIICLKNRINIWSIRKSNCPRFHLNETSGYHRSSRRRLYLRLYIFVFFIFNVISFN